MIAPPPRSLPSPGTVLANKYRIERLVGEGGMGVVFEATHLRIGQRVAIKMLHPQVLAQPELVARFEREARAAGQLRSPSVARVVDVDATPDGLPYIVMEFLEGHDLAKELEARGPLPVEEAVECVLQAASAMHEAHAFGIVHRDLKPSNLFLAREAAGVRLKVLDFGISKMHEDHADVRVTSTLATMGTPLYMSPEQVRSAKNVDARADVWSLGVILFELLTGRAPFVGSAMAVSAAIVADPAPSPRSLRPEVPEALEQVILKALAKVPEARWPDMEAFGQALAPFAGARIAISPRQAGTTVVSTPSLASGPTLAASTPMASAPDLGAVSSSQAPATGTRRAASTSAKLAVAAVGAAAVGLVVVAAIALRPKASESAPSAAVPLVASGVAAPSVSSAPRRAPAPEPAEALVPADEASPAGSATASATPRPRPAATPHRAAPPAAVPSAKAGAQPSAASVNNPVRL